MSSHTQNGVVISEHVWGKIAATTIKFMRGLKASACNIGSRNFPIVNSIDIFLINDIPNVHPQTTKPGLDLSYPDRPIGQSLKNPQGCAEPCTAASHHAAAHRRGSDGGAAPTSAAGMVLKED